MNLLLIRKTFVLPVDDKLVLLVVNLISQSPLTESFYNIYSRAGLFQSSLLEQDEDTLSPIEQLTEAFGRETLMARYEFKVLVVATTDPDDTLLDTEDTSDDVTEN